MIYILLAVIGLVVLYLIYFRHMIKQASTTPLFHPDVPDKTESLEIQNFNYREGEGFPWSGKIYAPEDATNQIPCVVFIHGEIPDFINPKPADWKIFDDYGKLLASKGFSAVIFNHRSSKNTKNAAPAREDMLDLLKYLREGNHSYLFNRENIQLWGFSGAPYIGLNWLIRERPEYIKGMVSYYGVLEGKEEGESAIELIQNEAAGKLPPLLIVKAEKDRVRSSIKAADLFYEKAKEKTEVNLLSHSGPHGFDVLSRNDETIDIINKTIDFLRSHE